jgi:hypothetical protein
MRVELRSGSQSLLIELCAQIEREAQDLAREFDLTVAVDSWDHAPPCRSTSESTP